MLYVYPVDCTDFSGNGLGSLSPVSALVKETLNGAYELEVVHPYDDVGKWRRLVEGCIIRAPVPSAMTPRVDSFGQDTGSVTEVYRITTQRDPLRLRSGTGTNYSILSKYPRGTLVIVTAKTTASWYEVVCPDGKRGYMASEYLTLDHTDVTSGEAVAEVVESRQLRDQPFRIYRIVPELDKITVYARHIFYDLAENMVQRYAPAAGSSGVAAVRGLSAACLSGHGFTFYSDLDTTAEDVSFENKNPVDCLLGDGGLVEKYGGELQRDWFDVFVVQRVGSDTNLQIRQGKNLTGIKYDLDIGNLVTRIMPTGQDSDGNVLYLPELFIDSLNAGQYISPKWIHLPVSEAHETTSGDEQKTKAQCYDAMREAARAEFEKGCDLPEISLTVNFIAVDETEEYRPYAFLRGIFLGDAIRVIARRIGVEVSMRMTAYTYNCLTRQYEQMTLGTVADTVGSSMISARQLPSGIVTGSKLALGSVGIGQLQPGSVGPLQVREAAIGNAHIQNAAVGAANIQSAAIAYAHIAEATVNALNSGALEATTAKIGSLTASDIETDTLAAALAAFMVITCGTASFDRATVTHLVANALNLSFGVGDDVFIDNLRVAYAQVVAATIGSLCIRASDGNYYAIDVAADGTVSATAVIPTEEETEAGQTETGRVIMETDIVAENLSTSNLLATYALVNQIDAARIDVDALFAREAFIGKLRTSEIVAGKSLTIIAGEAAEAKQKADSSVAATTILYASGDSPSVAPESGWSTVPPEHQEGRYVWQKVQTAHNNGTMDETDPVNISGADGEPATTLRIDSSRGTVFKNNDVSTVLSAVVYRGGERITEMQALRRVFGQRAYLQWSWQRLDENRFGVISADDTRIGDDGFSLTLSADDVDTKVTFLCELIID